MNKIKVLIIDDSALVRKVLAETINSTIDITVVGTAANPFIGRDMIVQFKPDVLLLDIEMPKMDGLEFIKSVRIEDKFKNLPVIALTSLDDEEHRQIALAAGFDYYEIKLKEQELMKTVKKILAEARSVM